MEKTTVYLPAELKTALSRAARSTGRSEAELIREGVGLVTGTHRIAEPRLPLFESGQPDLAEHVDELRQRALERLPLEYIEAEPGDRVPLASGNGPEVDRGPLPPAQLVEPDPGVDLVDDGPSGPRQSWGSQQTGHGTP